MSDLTRLQTAEPALLTDGSNSVAVLNSAPVGTEYGLAARVINAGTLPIYTYPAYYPTYGAGGGFTLTSVAAASTTSLFYLWHPSTVTTRYEIKRIFVTTYSGAGTSSDLQIRVSKLSAISGTPGGTTVTPVVFDGADTTSGATFTQNATGAPTRSAIPVVSRAALGTAIQTFSIEFPNSKPLVCRASTAEGWEVNLLNGSVILTTMKVAFDVLWTEF